MRRRLPLAGLRQITDSFEDAMHNVESDTFHLTSYQFHPRQQRSVDHVSFVGLHYKHRLTANLIISAYRTVCYLLT